MDLRTKKPWYKRSPKHWAYYRQMPLSRLWSFLAAVFCLFFFIGFIDDLLAGAQMPYAIALLIGAYCGTLAMMAIVVVARLPYIFLVIPLGLQSLTFAVIHGARNFLDRHFHLPPVQRDDGIHFAAIGIMIVVIASYALFITFIRGQGQESIRIQNELELAHGIQKTLVPSIHLRTASFELYGRSDPSEKVGGDLVDAVQLENGSIVAYLADIAGHGLQAGILMGMVKTAARTALLDAGSTEAHIVLPSLMDRLNRVLPDVKESQMYATFAGFRLNPDGSIFYALAAQPPILHYRAGTSVQLISIEQFPLGLLPVSGYSSEATTTAPGDLLIAVTDGILEASNKTDDEFGLVRLEEVIARHAAGSLPTLAQAILDAARAFGKQIDDQTLLLIRRL